MAKGLKDDFKELGETMLLGLVITVLVLGLNGRLGNSAPVAAEKEKTTKISPDSIKTPVADSLRMRLRDMQKLHTR